MNNWGIKEKKNRESFEHNPPRPSVERIFGMQCIVWNDFVRTIIQLYNYYIFSMLIFWL